MTICKGMKQFFLFFSILLLLSFGVNRVSHALFLLLPMTTFLIVLANA